MKLNIINIRKSINQAFLKVKPNRIQIESFKSNLINLIDQINDLEHEEHNKNNLIKFLSDTYYSPEYYVNTKGRTDLVIHNGKDSSSPVGVLIETKKPSNKSEMPTKDNLNSKALQELILYYLRERISENNKDIKHLIITNIYEWFIFDVNEFYTLFAQNKKLVKQFNDFETGVLEDSKTDYFYKQIAEPFLNELDSEISFTYLDIRNYEKIIKNDDKPDDKKLIPLFKLFSPENLLKLPFANDSNSLDKGFYTELLHIIGLQETKEGSKKLIGRKAENERNPGSLIENTVTILRYEDCLSQIKASDYGTNQEEQLYNVALELVITWINRVLFLKLLEGQLVKYHSGDKSFKFLNIERIPDFDALNKLFFQVLAIKESERNDSVKKKFGKIPYLNSSLFEPNELEHKTVRVSNLEDEYSLPILSSTVLKEKTGKRKSGELNTLKYLFDFLDSYDFTSEGAEEIQEENKRLINASVLGLIFEKINGYKDGSFFTPGFITMYMCRETIRRAVVQKFNETKNWNCKSIDDVYDKIEDKVEANKIINDLKICDPAVGSGHFLVSALNEIIAIKNDLRILSDREGKRLKEYQVKVVNDELVITDEDGELFEYKPKNKESQRIQETLFHEKQSIIETCLFGVDINPNSVKICRLRLWIELLKNAYYKQNKSVQTGHALSQLETLPNIDINIKCGNSLISRFDLDSDLKQALRKSDSKWTVDSYRLAVASYRHSESKEHKHEMERLINEIKTNFRSEISQNDPKIKRLRKLNGELFTLTNQGQLFELSKKEKTEWNKKVKKLTEQTQKIEKEIEEIKNNKIYENAFEWRFEFPEVLNDDGDFIGFDVVIGNPPYILVQSLGDKNIFNYYSQFFKSAAYKIDTYALFYEIGVNLLADRAMLCYISPNTFLKNKHAIELRRLILSNSLIEIINFYTQVFEDASVDTLILMMSKGQKSTTHKFVFSAYKNNVLDLTETQKVFHQQSDFQKGDFELELDIDADLRKLLTKIELDATPLKEFGRSYFGIQTFDRKKFVSKEKLNENYQPVIDGGNVKRYKCEPSTGFVNFTKEAIKSGGDLSVYKKYRIVVRQIGVFPEGTLVEPDLMTLNTIYNIFLHKDDNRLLKFLLALINSKVFQFYWFKKYYDNKATFPKIKKAPIESLPIKIPEPEIIAQISDLVEKVLNNKKQDIETLALEKQIDQLVYELYGLTEEEIKIVEAS